MRIARVRVEARKMYPGARQGSIFQLYRNFKRACEDYGIMHEFKEHQFFVRKCDKRRRKKMQKKMMARQEFKEEVPENRLDSYGY